MLYDDSPNRFASAAWTTPSELRALVESQEESDERKFVGWIERNNQTEKIKENLGSWWVKMMERSVGSRYQKITNLSHEVAH